MPDVSASESCTGPATARLLREGLAPEMTGHFLRLRWPVALEGARVVASWMRRSALPAREAISWRTIARTSSSVMVELHECVVTHLRTCALLDPESNSQSLAEPDLLASATACPVVVGDLQRSGDDRRNVPISRSDERLRAIWNPWIGTASAARAHCSCRWAIGRQSPDGPCVPTCWTSRSVRSERSDPAIHVPKRSVPAVT